MPKLPSTFATPVFLGVLEFDYPQSAGLRPVLDEIKATGYAGTDWATGFYATDPLLSGAS